jgi:putative transposase
MKSCSLDSVKAPKWPTTWATNPTIRAKLGTKRHGLIDARWVPIAVEIIGTNIHDKWMAGAMLDAVVLRRHAGRVGPGNLCLGKGFG